MSVLHYDGTPITARFIIAAISEHVAFLNVTPIKKVAQYHPIFLLMRRWRARTPTERT